MLRSTALTLALALTPITLQAQTAAEIREAVEDGLTAANAGGANISIGRKVVEAGNVLLLEDIRMAPEEGDEVVVTTDWIRIAPSTEDAGGLTVTLAPEILMTTQMEDGVDPVTFTFSQEGLTLTTNWILGAAGKPAGSVTAERFSLRAGEAGHPMIRDIDISVSDLLMQVALDEDSRSGTASLAFAELLADYDIRDPEGARMVMTSRTEGIDISMSGSNLQEGDMDLTAFLAGGGAIRFDLRSGATRAHLASDNPGFPLTVNTEGGVGEVTLSIDANGFDMGWRSEALRYEIDPGDGPMPIPAFTVALGGSVARLAMPLVPQEEARPAAFRFALADLTASEGLWSLLDPGQTIPRDPISLDIDLYSMARLFIPLDQAEDGASPMELGEFTDIRVDALNLSGGGARVTAQGAVDMDYSTPMPMPEGQIDVAFHGVQRLSQALVELGLIEQMQVGVMMGMIMAFSKPAEEPDSFTSLIEFREGQILANGAPIPVQ